MERKPATTGAEPPEPRPGSRGRPPELASSDLLRGGKIVEIHHNGEVYRLQATRLGKLILTK